MKRFPLIKRMIRSAPFRMLQLVIGIVLMLAAPIIGIPTPGPLGIFIFAIGFGLVLRNSRWARRQYVRHTRRYPRLQRAVNFGLRRKSKRQQPPDSPPLPHDGTANRQTWRRRSR
ncbi:hypothetical protein GCM10011529_25540 [Polymorphobacter glacialis]|uniref:DUF454 family protein n=1 Tax=Sandarakinorhabdus glacialis TaxID=1614636 RepID=A0A916ZYF1_9SPHN|nr:hypothetical protein [Polymorphobacter glacialis]GGE17919.1 hypothetical protein GCM10011529_25540 [Polymorphobacter glacialis]